MPLSTQTTIALEKISSELESGVVFDNEPKPTQTTKTPAISRRAGGRFSYALPSQTSTTEVIDEEIIEKSAPNYKLLVNLFNIIMSTSDIDKPSKVYLADESISGLKFFKGVSPGFLINEIEVVLVLNDKDSKVIVSKDNLNKLIVVAFHYTGKVNIETVDYKQITEFPSEDKLKDIKVVESYYQSLKSLQKKHHIFEKVKELLFINDGYKLLVTGHSTGGSVASLFGIEAQSLGWNPTVVTFGAPKIAYSTNKANTFFKQVITLFNITSDSIDDSDSYTNLLDPHKPFFINVENAADIVPSLPLDELEKLGGIRYIYKQINSNGSGSTFHPQFLAVDPEYRLESRGAKKTFSRFKKAIPDRRETLHEKLVKEGITLNSRDVFDLLNSLPTEKAGKLGAAHNFYGLQGNSLRFKSKI